MGCFAFNKVHINACVRRLTSVIQFVRADVIFFSSNSIIILLQTAS